MITVSQYQEDIDRFRIVSEGNYIFACQAAVPLLMTPDLLYQLWNNFKQYQYIFEPGDAHKTSHLAVSDLLLSGLCREVGFELYEMDKGVRDILLEDLVLSLGERRKHAIAAFLRDYALQERRSSRHGQLQQVHLLTAQSVLDPSEMERQIIDGINEAVTDTEKINYLLLHHHLLPLGLDSELGKISEIVGAAAAGKPLAPVLIAEENPDAPGVLKVMLPSVLRGKVHTGRRSIVQARETGIARALQLIDECARTGNTDLDLANCGLRDEDLAEGRAIDVGLRNCVHLQGLYFSNSEAANGERNLLTCLPPAIAELERLETLICAGERRYKWAIEDMSLVRHLHNLIHLDLSNNCIAVMEGLEGMSQLGFLFLEGNQIRELKGSFNLPALRFCDLGLNEIRDLSPLLPLLQRQEYPMEIDLSGNKSGTKIMLGGNPIENPPMEVILEGREAVLKYFAEQEQPKPDIRKISIFQPDPELREDRMEFEIFLARKNEEWEKKNIFLEVIAMEDFGNVISRGQIADLYNKAITQSEIIVIFLSEGAPKYFIEEFEFASLANNNNKPSLFIYFKGLGISGIIKTAALNFGMLKNLYKEHYSFMAYKNIDDVFNNFNTRLEELLDIEPRSPDVQPAPLAVGATQFPKELTLNIPRGYYDDILAGESELEGLHAVLSTQGRNVVINGLVGVGKTALAKAYVSQCYNYYRHIAWITQASQEFPESFLTAEGLPANLDIDLDGSSPTQSFRAILEKLKSIPDRPNLLVIDDTNGSLEYYMDMLPPRPGWYLLVTSRHTIRGLYSHLAGFLDEEAAMRLFKRYYTKGQLSGEDIARLVEALEYHTLSIFIMAKTAYWLKYDLNRLLYGISQDRTTGPTADSNRSKDMRIRGNLRALLVLVQFDEDQMRLLKNIAYLPSSFLSHDFLTELIDGGQRIHKYAYSNRIEPVALVEIVEKGWLLYDPLKDSYKMPDMIAGLIREGGRIDLSEISHLIDTVTRKLLIDRSQGNPVDKFFWIPYGKAILENYGDDGSNEIAALQNNLGKMLMEYGDYTEGKVLFEKSAGAAEKNFGVSNPVTLERYANLAMALDSLGSYADAKILLERVVQTNEEYFGPGDHGTAIGYTNLGKVYRHLREYDAAKAMLEKAIQSNELLFGPDHPITAKCYLNLADVLRDLGDYQQAASLYEKALRIYEQTFGPEHPSTAINYNKLAQTLLLKGQPHEALDFAYKALGIFSKILPKSHPRVVTAEQTVKAIETAIGEQSS